MTWKLHTPNGTSPRQEKMTQLRWRLDTTSGTSTWNKKNGTPGKIVRSPEWTMVINWSENQTGYRNGGEQ